MENIINEYFNKSTKILESEKCFNEEELLAYQINSIKIEADNKIK